MVFELFDEAEKPKPRTFNLSPDANTDRQRVEVCIQEVLRQGTYIGDSYGDWYEVGCSLANEFGESGRHYFHQISQNYPGYQPTRTDRQFTACPKANSKATLGTFFYLCQQQSIEWKELIPCIQQEKREHSFEQPPAPVFFKTIAEQLARPGSSIKPDESQLERLVVELCNDYPDEWSV